MQIIIIVVTWWVRSFQPCLHDSMDCSLESLFHNNDIYKSCWIWLNHMKCIHWRTRFCFPNPSQNITTRWQQVTSSSPGSVGYNLHHIPMFIQPTITRIPSVSSGCIGLDTKMCWTKESDYGKPTKFMRLVFTLMQQHSNEIKLKAVNSTNRPPPMSEQHTTIMLINVFKLSNPIWNGMLFRLETHFEWPRVPSRRVVICGNICRIIWKI